MFYQKNNIRAQGNRYLDLITAQNVDLCAVPEQRV
jgi:hypothetical protein